MFPMQRVFVELRSLEVTCLRVDRHLQYGSRTKLRDYDCNISENERAVVMAMRRVFVELKGLEVTSRRAGGHLQHGRRTNHRDFDLQYLGK